MKFCNPPPAMANSTGHRGYSFSSGPSVRVKNRRATEAACRVGIEALERRVLLAAIAWTASGDGFWDDGSNWSLNRAPAAGDDVTINAPSATVTVRNPGQRADKLVSNATVRVLTGADIALQSTASQVSGSVLIEGGGFTVVGGSSIATLSWFGGAFNAGFGGNTTVSTLNLNSTTDVFLQGLLNLTGTATHVNKGRLGIDNNTDLTISGTYLFGSDADIFNDQRSGGVGPEIFISGTLRKTAGAGVSAITVNQSTDVELLGGTLEALSGTLELAGIRGADSSGGTIIAASSATVLLSDVNATFSGTYTGTGAGRVEFSGGTMSAGSGGLTFNFAQGLFHWTGGVINNLTNAGSITLSGSAERRLGGVLTNNGTITHAGDGSLTFDGGSRLDNAGLYTFTGTGLIARSDFFGGASPYFNNTGTLRKTGAGTATIDQDASIGFRHGGGTIDVQQGTLHLKNLSAGGTDSTGATFTVATGALVLWDSNAGYAGTYSGSGGGIVRITGNWSALDPGATWNFAQGMLEFGGGSINGTSFGNNDLTNAGFLTFAGDDDRSLARTLINTGTIRHIGAGNLSFNGTVRNEGTYDFQSDADLASPSGGGQFDNFGTLQKSGGLDVTGLDVNFNNKAGGQVTVTSGTLSLTRGGTNVGGGVFNVVAGAVLDFAAPGTHSFSGEYTNVGTGIIRFSGVINGNDDANPGIFNFTGTSNQWAGNQILGTLINRGTATIVGSDGIFMRAGFTNEGTINHVGTAALALNANSHFTNSGLYDLQNDAELVVPGDASGGAMVWTNTGTLRKSGGAGTSSVRHDGSNKTFRFDNTGNVQVLSGTLAFADPMPQVSGSTLSGGTWLVGPASTLMLPSSSITTNQGNVTLSGAASTFAAINALSSNSGTFTVTGGRDFTTAGGLTNTGTLTAGPGSQIAVSGALNSSGTLGFAIGGNAASGLFGQINSTGGATLSGTAAVTLDGGFGPALGEAYTLMTFPSHTGDFANVTGLDPFFASSLTATAFALNATSGVQAADLAIDAASISIPVSGTLGQGIAVSYTVNNLSPTLAPGTWADSIFLSRDQTFDPSDVLLGRVEHTGGVVASSSYTEQVTLPLPGVPDDDYFAIVVVDSRKNVTDSDLSNNIGASATDVTTTIAELVYGQTTTGTVATDQDVFYRLPRPLDADARIDATFEVPLEAELFVGRGELPTRSDWAYTSSNLFALNRRLDLTFLVDADYYILIHGREGAGTGKTFTLTPTTVSIEVQSVGPEAIANTGTSTLRIQGLGFNPATTATLIAADGREIGANVVYVELNTSLFATFDLNGASPGLYDVRVNRPDGETFTLPDSLTVNASTTGGHLFTVLSSPGTIRPGRKFQFQFEYGNDGDADLIAPWVTISVGEGTRWNIRGEDEIDARHLDLLAISPDGIAGVLRPGERVKIVFEATWESGNPPQIQSWGGVERQQLTPDEMIEAYGGTPGEAPWDGVASLLAQRFGSTRQSYRTELARLASRLSQFGNFERRVDRLIETAVFNALLDTSLHALAPGAVPQRTLPTDDAYVPYDTGPGTEGDGARLPDGRWTPYVPAREPTFLELQEAEGEVFIRQSAISGIFFLREEWTEWANLWLSGTGQPWVATFDSRIAREILEYIHVATQQDKDIWSLLSEDISFGRGPFGDVAFGESTIHYVPTTTNYGVNLAEYRAPAPGDPKWSFGGTTLIAGKSPAANIVGWDVDLERFSDEPAGDIVKWTSRDVPMRIEDNFTVDEHVVNKGAKRNGQAAFKNDLGFYAPFYLTETFGRAKAFKWYVNMILPEMKGEALLAGVKADAGGDQTYYIPDGQTSVNVTLQGDAKFALTHPIATTEGQPFVWNGVPVNPTDSQTPTVTLTPGTYVFTLEVKGHANGASGVSQRLYGDFDSITVRVLSDDDDPDPKPKRRNPGPVRSSDPNDITGPGGFGDANFVTPQQTFPYTIRFENQATATAPAQEVFITQQLDADLDWNTFELGDVGFGDVQVSVPAGRNVFAQRIDLTQSLGLFVDFDAGVDLTTGIAHWTFRAIDPETGDLVSDPLAGFLPPNVTSPQGEGFANYSIGQKAGLASGTTIDAQARIVFDVNAPIDTNQYVNTIDRGIPTSSVAALPANSPQSFTLSWAGADDAGGSGVGTFDIFVSDNGGPFTLLLDNTAELSTTSAGEDGHVYGFYSVATDNVGFAQDTPGAAQASTTVIGIPPLGARVSSDPDDPTRNILTVGGSADADEIRVKRRNGQTRVIINDVEAGLFNNVGRIEIYGGEGDDVIKIDDGVRISAIIFGGAGNDSLRGARRHDRLFGEDGDDTLKGGQGNDVLVGGEGNDRLEGGASRDVLIGGLGRDKLRGEALSDLQIGGYTSHDADTAVLGAIRDSWNGKSSYRSRIAQLFAGSAPILGGADLFSDGARDDISDQFGRDWFIADTTGNNRDGLGNFLREDETITDLSV